ncbi:hypothetical protein FRC17_009861 [Serendipita sp. 399]|nr:hypothetical protein FRC17_009861 [Serendipita sp. 399]
MPRYSKCASCGQRHHVDACPSTAASAPRFTRSSAHRQATQTAAVLSEPLQLLAGVIANSPPVTEPESSSPAPLIPLHSDLSVPAPTGLVPVPLSPGNPFIGHDDMEGPSIPLLAPVAMPSYSLLPLLPPSPLAMPIQMASPSVEGLPPPLSDIDSDWVPPNSPSPDIRQRTTASQPSARTPEDNHVVLPPSIVAVASDLANKKRSALSATDIWYFILPLSSKDLPEGHETLPFPAGSKRPESAFLGCFFCSNHGVSQTWQNVEGITSPIRRHFEAQHEKEWKVTCISLKLKHWERYAEEATPKGQAARRAGQREEWSLEGFLDRLIKWMVVDDQSYRTVDSKEFRDLLLFCGRQLQDKDIPHRDRLGRLVMTAFKDSWENLVAEIASSEGETSLTADMWTSPAKVAFMAITAHFIVRNHNCLEMRARLVAFRKIEGEHSGANMARHMAQVLHELKLTRTVGQITLDNASNNDTMMRSLDYAMSHYDIGAKLLEKNHRCRCFPHIVNIAVRTALKSITNVVEPDPLTSDTATASLDGSDRPYNEDEDPVELEPECVAGYPADWHRVLKRDVIAKTRALVNACRKSPQRRESLQQYITKGREAGDWTLKSLQLIKDVDTRWSAVYLMIERYLYLHPAIDSWLGRADQSDLRKYRLERREVTVLEEVKQFLGHFHDFQQLLSAEQTPTIQLVIPAFESLISNLHESRQKQLDFSHAYSIALLKLTEYKQKCLMNPVYTLAMAVFPPLKLCYFDRRWPLQEAKAARQLLRDEMYRIRLQQQNSVSKLIPPTASQLRDSANPLTRTIHQLLNKSTRPGSNAPLPTPVTPIRAAADQLRRDWVGVDTELRAYEEEDSIDLDSLLNNGSNGLLSYWNSRRDKYPILYQIAMNILPAQGSAVSSERVFSSAKRTITDARNRLLPHAIESRQILKFMLKSNRLSLRGRWGISPVEAAALTITEDLESALKARDMEAVDKLMAEVDFFS